MIFKRQLFIWFVALFVFSLVFHLSLVLLFIAKIGLPWSKMNCGVCVKAPGTQQQKVFDFFDGFQVKWHRNWDGWWAICKTLSLLLARQCFGRAEEWRQIGGGLKLLLLNSLWGVEIGVKWFGNYKLVDGRVSANITTNGFAQLTQLAFISSQLGQQKNVAFFGIHQLHHVVDWECPWKYLNIFVHQNLVVYKIKRLPYFETHSG